MNELEITDSGFTIMKEISEGSGEHMQVDLEITSSYDEQVTVTIAEPLPPGTDPTQIGFLPDKEPLDSRVTDDGQFLLDAKLIAGGNRTIVYGLKDIEPEEVEVLANDPQVVRLEGSNGEEMPIDADERAEAAEAAEGAVESEESETESDEHETESEEHGTDEHEGDEPETEADESNEEASETATAATDGAQPLQPPLDDDLAEELAAELEPHLDTDDAVTDTKLSQLQEDVADVRVYLPALEEFLGEAGRADEIVDELDELRDQLGEFDELPDEFEETMAEIDTQLEQLEETASDLDEQLEAVNERIAELEDWRDEIASVSGS